MSRPKSAKTLAIEKAMEPKPHVQFRKRSFGEGEVRWWRTDWTGDQFEVCANEAEWKKVKATLQKITQVEEVYE